MPLYLASTSIHTPEVQYGFYTALGIVHSCSKASQSNFDLTIKYAKSQLWAFLGLLPSFFGNEKLQIPRGFFRTPLRGMSVDFHMSGRKFSMPSSRLFPQNTIGTKLEKKHFLSGKKLISKMALFFAFWRKYGTRYSILGVPYFLGFCF